MRMFLVVSAFLHTMCLTASSAFLGCCACPTQVPYVHLTNLLHDYLQRPLAVPPVKSFVVRTEGEILQMVGWDALQPAQLSLTVMEQLLGVLHSDHPVH